MSWTWSIPFRARRSLLLQSPLLNSNHTRVIVPTFRDWEDARLTVESLMECSPRPAEIALVSDNYEPEPPTWVRRFPIHFVNYVGNRGPSFARNAGARLRTGRHIDWFVFTDTGCTREPAFFAILAESSMAMPRSTVAIAGPVRGVVVSPKETPINYYMTEEAILNPPIDDEGPQAIVTANAAVSAPAFWAVGGFDTSYPLAGGEDLDLGLRLRAVGTIGWAPHAVVKHRFAESIDDLRRRFNRYGAGNAHLEHQFHLPSMRVRSIVARDADLQRIADVQVRAMQEGYDRHREGLIEMKLRLRHRSVLSGGRITNE